MSNFSFKNKKFPIKAAPTFLLAISVSFLMSFFSIIFLQDAKQFLDLKDYDVEDIEYELITSEVLRTVHSQNLDTLYRHRELPVFLERVSKRWLPNFFGALSDDRHARTAHLVERASTATGVNYDTGISIFYNALWHKQISFNWSQYLRLEKAASDLGLGAHAA